jgi:hypothetical protein
MVNVDSMDSLKIEFQGSKNKMPNKDDQYSSSGKSSSSEGEEEWGVPYFEPPTSKYKSGNVSKQLFAFELPPINT